MFIAPVNVIDSLIYILLVEALIITGWSYCRSGFPPYQGLQLCFSCYLAVLVDDLCEFVLLFNRKVSTCWGGLARVVVVIKGNIVF